MPTVSTIGLDIAKSVFQVHGIDAEGKVVIRRQLKRHYVLAFFEKLPPCLIGMKLAQPGCSAASTARARRARRLDLSTCACPVRNRSMVRFGGHQVT